MTPTHECGSSSAYTNERRGYAIVLVIGIVEICCEIALGYWVFNNIINLAGGVHTSFDSTDILASLIAVTLVIHNRTREVRIRTQFAVFGILLLIAGGTFVLTEAYDRLVQPEAANAWVALTIGSISAVANCAKEMILHRHSSTSITHALASKHVRGDLYLALAAVASATVRLLAEHEYAPWWLEAHVLIIDPLSAAGVAFYLYAMAWTYMKRIAEGKIVRH